MTYSRVLHSTLILTTLCLSALLLTACASHGLVAGAACAKTTDCTKGLFCTDGKCQDSKSCYYTSDCTNGDSCVSGTCQGSSGGSGSGGASAVPTVTFTPTTYTYYIGEPTKTITPAVTGGGLTLTWTLTAGAAGPTLPSDGSTSLSFAPAAAGTWTFHLTAKNAVGTASADVTVTVAVDYFFAYAELDGPVEKGMYRIGSDGSAIAQVAADTDASIFNGSASNILRLDKDRVAYVSAVADAKAKLGDFTLHVGSIGGSAAPLLSTAEVQGRASCTLGDNTAWDVSKYCTSTNNPVGCVVGYPSAATDCVYAITHLSTDAAGKLLMFAISKSNPSTSAPGASVTASVSLSSASNNAIMLLDTSAAPPASASAGLQPTAVPSTTSPLTPVFSGATEISHTAGPWPLNRPRYYAQPSLSPDGTKFAVTATNTPVSTTLDLPVGDIEMYALSGTSATLIGATAPDTVASKLSPTFIDSNRVVYARFAAKGGASFLTDLVISGPNLQPPVANTIADNADPDFTALAGPEVDAAAACKADTAPTAVKNALAACQATFDTCKSSGACHCPGGSGTSYQDVAGCDTCRTNYRNCLKGPSVCNYPTDDEDFCLVPTSRKKVRRVRRNQHVRDALARGRLRPRRQAHLSHYRVSLPH